MHKRLFHCTMPTLAGVALTLALLWLGAATPTQANPGPRYVAPPPSGSDTGNDCTNPSNPCATIQHAIDVADPADPIRVAGGTYAPGGTVAVITKELTIIGSFDPDFTAPDPDLYQTVLDAGWNGSVISITSASDVLLQHLTLTHGDGTGNCGSNGCGGGIHSTGTNLRVAQCVITDNLGTTAGQGQGGGVYASASGHNVEIWESLVVSNTANPDPLSSHYGNGGGIYIDYGTVSLWENEITDNVAHAWMTGFGGGIYLADVSHTNVLSNVIRGNKANGVNSPYGSYGGGLYIVWSTAVTVAHNQIEDNLTNGSGGGVEVVASEGVHLSSNSLVGNTAAGGGGVNIESTEPVTLSNNLIARNFGSFRGGGVYVGSSFQPPYQAILVNNTIADNVPSGVDGWKYTVITLTNNLLAGNKTGITVTTPSSAIISADTNLFWNTSDPITGSNAMLTDPLLTANYHLSEGSPALDAGLDVPWLTVDLEGNPRPSGAYDIGAFEGVWWDTYLPLIAKSYAQSSP